MHLILYLLTFFSLSYAYPTLQDRQTCNALIEQTPWLITNLKVFVASPESPSSSSLSFHIVDANPGLEFETNCEITMPIGTGARPDQAEGWHPCEVGHVYFLFQPGELQVKRGYKDDCLGPAPWNGGTFYGSAKTMFTVSVQSDGQTWTSTDLVMPITSQTN
ncbi:hypothetical protein Q7P37_006921 [Cladosporium fusiforme]